MAANHAVVVDRAVPGTLAVREVARPTPSPSEALVRVRAISLNRGETRRAMEAAVSWYPGWDLAGVVVQAAADGSGPSARALAALAKDGVCVSLGGSASHEATCDFKTFRQTGRTTLHGFMLFEEFALEPASVGLAHLAGLVAGGQLTPTISVEAPWTQIGQVARQLLDRKFAGKAVLHVETESG